MTDGVEQGVSDRGGEATAIDLVVNGQPRQVSAGSTVSTLIDSLGLGRSPCAVEVNRRVVVRRDHGSTPLASGDRIEIVTLVGGG